MFLPLLKIQIVQANFTLQCQFVTRLEPVNAAVFASFSLMVDSNHNDNNI